MCKEFTVIEVLIRASDSSMGFDISIMVLIEALVYDNPMSQMLAVLTDFEDWSSINLH